MDAYVEPFIKKLLEQYPTFIKYFKALHRSDTNYRIHYQEGALPESLFGVIFVDYDKLITPDIIE
jgi:hypothetical protein